MNKREQLIRLLGSPSGARELLHLARTDGAIAEALDSLEDLEPEQALTLLGAIEDASDESDLDEDAAAGVRRDVSMLLEDATPRERELLNQVDALVIDGALEALSNLFRRNIRGETALVWASNEDVFDDYHKVASSSDLGFELARYLQLWANESPSSEVPRLVTWAHRAVARAPELFRHVRVDGITDQGVTLKLQPPEMWTKPRHVRWSLRASTASKRFPPRPAFA